MSLLRPKPRDPKLPVFDVDKVKPPIKRDLTPKEREALLAACGGYNNKEIAIAMGTSLQVTKNYLRAAYIKIGVNDGASSRVNALLFAIRNGWFNPFSD